MWQSSVPVASATCPCTPGDGTPPRGRSMKAETPRCETHLAVNALLHPLVVIVVLGPLPQVLGLGRLRLPRQVRLQTRRASHLEGSSARGA